MTATSFVSLGFTAAGHLEVGDLLQLVIGCDPVTVTQLPVPLDEDADRVRVFFEGGHADYEWSQQVRTMCAVISAADYFTDPATSAALGLTTDFMEDR